MTRSRSWALATLALVATACNGKTEEVTDPEPTPATSSSTAGPETTNGSTNGSQHPSSPAHPQPDAVTVTSLPSGISPQSAREVAVDLDVPWGIDFLPAGDALVTERDTANLLSVSPDGEVTPLGVVPGVTPTSEGGLLGVAISPTYEDDQTVFVYATTAEDNRVLSGTLEELVSGESTAILTGIPRGDIHDGGRLGFGPDDKLYVTTGETGDADLAQDLDSLGGKILRIEPDGTVPADNPFEGSPVWTYGHRNVQGIAWDDEGRMWATEFGSQVWDEVNLIEPGNNYGWPAAEGTGDMEGMTDPYAVFSTFTASPSGLAYVDDALWLGALQGETTWRVPVEHSGLGAPVPVRLVEARIRTVVTAPDGSLWVTTSNTDNRAEPAAGDDRIFAVRP